MVLLLSVDSKKRLWIYSGMGMESGVGLVSTGQPAGAEISRGSKILLIGDALAQGLSTPLRQLAQADGVLFASDVRPSARLSEWSSQPWLRSDLTRLRPDFVLVLGKSDPVGPWVQTIFDTVRSSGSLMGWISPPRLADPNLLAYVRALSVPVFHSEALGIPRNTNGIFPTPAEYAGWSALVWRWLTSGSKRIPYDQGPYRAVESKPRKRIFARR